MGDSVGFSKKFEIPCSNCKRMRYGVVADKDESACVSAINHERKFGLCSTCENSGLEAGEASSSLFFKNCKVCHARVHPGAWAEHQRKHQLAKQEQKWAHLTHGVQRGAPMPPKFKPTKSRAYRQDF